MTAMLGRDLNPQVDYIRLVQAGSNNWGGEVVVHISSTGQNGETIYMGRRKEGHTSGQWKQGDELTLWGCSGKSEFRTLQKYLLFIIVSFVNCTLMFILLINRGL